MAGKRFERDFVMTSRPTKESGDGGPLAGVRVLDLTRIMAGPWATQMLADLGADVIKVERPGVGDDTRSWGPPFLADKSGKPTSETAYNLAVNRGKRSMTVDLSKPEGQEIVKSLARKSDMLFENFKVGDLARYGLGYEALRDLHRGLIYCSITGFGQTGPYQGRRGYDFALQAMGGLMSVTGERDGQPGAGPEKVGVAVADIIAGMYANIAVISALWSRRASGAGQHIDISLLDAQVAMMANQNMNYLTTNVVPKRLGNAHPNIAPYQCFSTSDGYVVLTVGNDAQFVRFCAAADLVNMSSDPRFATNPARVTNREILIPILSRLLVTKTTAEWLAIFEAADVPCGPVNSLDAVFADEQIRHRGLKFDLPHPLSGTVPTVGSPMKFSATPLQYLAPAPLLGQHTDEVLSMELDFNDNQIAGLRSRGVI
jgi:crotonobetainyl-CoA:carnitine CoA-transferase CaiB-like acyl-CoA transferase